MDEETTQREIAHFTRNGVLWHAWYIHTAKKGWVRWEKVYGSEKPCDCPNRHSDRTALMGIRREA